MNKKKLSRSGSLQSSVTSVLAALLCILIGLLVGFLVLVAINPAHAWGDGFVRIIKGGFHDAPYGVGKELANAAPLIMTGLSVAFAFKTGLFNIGAAGQYTLGAYGALYCAIMLKLPWFVCLLAAAVLGGLWGAIPGFFKAYFNINEVITSIMFNWIGLYLVNELIYQNGTGPMYDVRNTRTLNLSKNADFAQSLIPDFGLNKLFQTNSTTIAIFLAAAVAVLIWVVLNKTTFGYELKAVGLNKNAARYAGIRDKRNIVLSMAIAGALAGAGAALYWLSGNTEFYWSTYQALPAVGFNGIPVALLALNNPIAVIFTGIFMAMLNIVGLQLTNLTAYNEYITDVIISVIVYLSAFSLAIRMMLSRKKKPHAHVEETAAPAADAAPPEEPAEEKSVTQDDLCRLRSIHVGFIGPSQLKRAKAEGKLDHLLDKRDEIEVPLDTGGDVTVVCCYVTPTSARFVFKDCWDEGVMNDEATNKTGYFKSKGRKHVLEDIYPHIAAEWREIIAPRTFVETIEGERVEYSDPLWLPSATDVFGAPDGAWWRDGDDDFQLPVFARERDRVKECGDKGTYLWWLRSVGASGTRGFCLVTADGSASSNTAYHSIGFAPGFDI